ncbi:MAG: response regulator transcription factor [Planctomycetales bacterium]|nr:response regulator transcription factor [Planctomycetales bacterium]
MDDAEQEQIVLVVDDDASMRNSILRLLKSEGYEARGFASATEFLENWSGDRHACLIADVWMPDMTGLQLQAELLERGVGLPIVLMSARALVPDVVQAIQNGAIDFLEKPFREDALIERVQLGLEQYAKRRRYIARLHQIDDLMSRLTERERQVMECLASGETTKQVAQTLAISSKTADVHRARVLEKLELGSVVDLVQLAHEHADLLALVDRRV